MASLAWQWKLRKSPAGIKTRHVKESRMSVTKNVFTSLRITASPHPISQRNDMYYLRLHYSLPSGPAMNSVGGFTLRSISPKGIRAKAHVYGVGAEQN